MIFGMPRALFPRLAVVQFHRGPEVVGLLFSALAFGALIGALTSGWVGGVRRPGRAILVAVALWGLAVVGFGLSGRNLVLAFAFLAIAGAADVISAVFRVVVAADHRSRLAARPAQRAEHPRRRGRRSPRRLRSGHRGLVVLTVHRGREWRCAVPRRCRGHRRGACPSSRAGAWVSPRDGGLIASQIDACRRCAIDSATVAGYSGTVLPKKLGITEGSRVALGGRARRFRTSADTAARGRADAETAAQRSRRRRVLRDAARRARAPLPASRVGAALRRRAVGRVAEAHRGSRDRPVRTRRARGRARRPGSSTTRCARSTTCGRACGSSTACPTVPRRSARAAHARTAREQPVARTRVRSIVVCGRYVSVSSPTLLAERLHVDEVRADRRRAQLQRDAARRGADRRRRRRSTVRVLDRVRWGLVPSWAKDLSIGDRLINARSDGVADEAGVPQGVREAAVPDSGRRLLRVARACPGPRKRKQKQPYFIARGRPRADGVRGSLRGVARPLRSRTRAVDPLVRDRHDRREREARADPRPDAGRVGRERVGRVARPRQPRHDAARAVARARAERRVPLLSGVDAREQARQPGTRVARRGRGADASANRGMFS